MLRFQIIKLDIEAKAAPLIPTIFKDAKGLVSGIRIKFKVIFSIAPINNILA